MKTLFVILSAAALLGAAAFQAPAQNKGKAGGPWVTLFDGTNLDNFNRVGNATWTVANGEVSGSSTGGNGYLVSKNSYTDFELSVEFFVDTPANSGVFIRCEDPANISAMNAYEVNIYDTRPDQSGRTGAIVDVAPPLARLDAGGKWNTFVITAQGPHLTVTMNGVKTVDVMDSKHARGPIALQYGSGVVKFRNVRIRTL
jgi:hypothetical protein